MLLAGFFFVAAFQAPLPQPKLDPCLPCHPREVANFGRSVMGNSVAVPATEPEGQFQHQASAASVHIFWKQGRLQQQIDQSGLRAELPAAYSIGFGSVGKSYLVEIDGRLFQSPAAYFTAKHAWAESPGYENDPVLDFWRPIDSSCLSCHTGTVQQTANRVTLTPISCDRCHGSSERHLHNPVPGSILNPARLTGRERDSICEQCHLEGASTVLNPRKHWGDFKPGEALEKVQVNYILQSQSKAGTGTAAVSHAQQLALSACKRAGPAKLWCATCHDPHAAAGNHTQQISGVCQGCHASTELARTHQAADTNCVACHMPKIRATDISHAAITDHRILKRPGTAPFVQPGKTAVDVVPWRPPDPTLLQRDLGLAFFNLARSGSLVEGGYPEAFRLLTSAPSATDDGVVAAAQGYMLLGSGHIQTAIEYFQRAVSADEQSAEYWLDLGVAEQAQGDIAGAQNSFRESIRRNPTDYRAYEALAALLQKNGMPQSAAETVQQFLQVYPQSILMRLRHLGSY